MSARSAGAAGARARGGTFNLGDRTFDSEQWTRPVVAW